MQRTLDAAARTGDRTSVRALSRPARQPMSNRALQRAAASRQLPAHVLRGAVRGWGNQAIQRMAIQRVEDADGSIAQTLKDVYAELYKKYKALMAITTGPAKMNRSIADRVKSAASKEDAYARFADLISRDYFTLTSSGTADKRQEVLDLCASKEAAAKAHMARQAEELKSLNAAGSSTRPTKKRRLDTSGSAKKVYSDEDQARLLAKLKDPAYQQKLYRGSMEGYSRHRSGGRGDVAKAAPLNRLDLLQPLSTADIAIAQANYAHSRTGESLQLEPPGPQSGQVTMTRAGGQEVHQLGPYLPGSKQSVKDIIQLLLKTTKLSSRELAEAINFRNVDDVVKLIKRKGGSASTQHVGKIRAMRQLLGIEKDRGPEVALATSLEHRSAARGYRHIEQYPSNTPLGPADATTDIRGARKRKLAEMKAGKLIAESRLVEALTTSEEPKSSPDAAMTEEAKTDAPTTDLMPSDFSYIPDYIQTGAMASITHFLTGFMADTKGARDREIENLVDVMLVDEESKAADDDFYDKVASVLRTPEYNPYFEDEEMVTGDEKESAGAIVGSFGAELAAAISTPLLSVVSVPSVPMVVDTSTGTLNANVVPSTTEPVQVVSSDADPLTATGLDFAPGDLEWLKSWMSAESPATTSFEGTQTSAAPTTMPEASTEIDPHMSETDAQALLDAVVVVESNQRFSTFLSAMRSLPQVPDAPVTFEERAPEAQNPTNLYVGAEEQTEKSDLESLLFDDPAFETSPFDFPLDLPVWFDATRFERISNPGGGDCLYHALAGRTLSPSEMLVERARVAAARHATPDSADRRTLNALNVANALHQTFPLYRGFVDALVVGRHQVPNTVYAAMQAVPGLYAGDDELIQWCGLTNQTVVVVDSAGTLAVYSARGRDAWFLIHGYQYQAVNDAWATADIALYKTPGHWERIVSVRPEHGATQQPQQQSHF